MGAGAVSYEHEIREIVYRELPCYDVAGDNTADGLIKALTYYVEQRVEWARESGRSEFYEN